MSPTGDVLFLGFAYARGFVWEEPSGQQDIYPPHFLLFCLYQSSTSALTWTQMNDKNNEGKDEKY